MSKKYLRKNEFRFNTNKETLNKKNKPHPSYISARYKQKFKENPITHARTIDGVPTIDLEENPNKNSTDTRTTRFGNPRWTNMSAFSEPLENFTLSRRGRAKIRKHNKKIEIKKRNQPE